MTGNLVIILGPTASGKTGAAIKLARETGGEIISADSVQIYADLKIGSAAPLPEEMEEIPHHLIGTLPLSEEMNAGRFIKLAKAAVADITSRGKTPIMVGGTNFYVASFLNGLSPIPDFTDEQKAEAENKYKDKPVKELFELLTIIDPAWSEAISSSNDIQRIMRGLEVYHITGRRLSEWNRLPRVEGYSGKVTKLGLKIHKDELGKRIDNRTNLMIKNGLLDEVRHISEMGFNPANCRALESIGYFEAFCHLDGTIKTEQELEELIALHTRQLAKRQMTWLKRDTDISWVPVI